MVHQKEPATQVAGSFLVVVTVYRRENGLTPVASAFFLLLIFQYLDGQRNGSVYCATNEGEKQKQFTKFQYTITSCLKWFNWQYEQ